MEEQSDNKQIFIPTSHFVLSWVQYTLEHGSPELISDL